MLKKQPLTFFRQTANLQRVSLFFGHRGFLDAMLIQWNCDKEERKGILQGAYDFQYPLLKRSATIEKLQDLAAKAKKS